MPPRKALPPAIQARYTEELAYMDRIYGASIYPAVQNIILACRALGLGTVLTTNHIRCESEAKAVLGLPEDVDTFGMMPIGYPLGRFGPLTRRPLNEVVCADRWGRLGRYQQRPRQPTLARIRAQCWTRLGRLATKAFSGVSIS
jgi:Nitroreductase family